MDPIGRLQIILPRLEALLKVNESPKDLAHRELSEFLQRIEYYSNEFNAFSHPNDPVLYNSAENMVYCKQWHYYVIFHGITKKERN